MTTYGDLQRRIADELCRNDLSLQIQRAIQSSILYFAHESFPFNTETANFITMKGKSRYRKETDLPSDFLMCLEIANPMDQTKLYELPGGATHDAMGPRSEGCPECYFRRSDGIVLHPVPDQAYELSIHYIRSATILVNDDDENFWTNQAGDLICAQAKCDLYQNIIHEFDAAQQNKLQVIDWADKHRFYYDRLHPVQRLRPLMF